MAKEFSTIVDQAIKDLCVEEENLLFTTSGGITKEAQKIKSKRFLYKKGVVKGPGKGTRLRVKGSDKVCTTFGGGCVWREKT